MVNTNQVHCWQNLPQTVSGLWIVSRARSKGSTWCDLSHSWEMVTVSFRCHWMSWFTSQPPSACCPPAWSTKPQNWRLKFSDSMLTHWAVSGRIRRIVKLKFLDVNRLMVKSCLGNFNTDVKVKVFLGPSERQSFAFDFVIWHTMFKCKIILQRQYW